MEPIDNKSLRNQIIESDHIIDACKSFLDINKGDEGAKMLILAITCEILDCSIDMLLDNLS